MNGNTRFRSVCSTVTARDLHPLDFIKKFHRLILGSSYPSFSQRDDNVGSVKVVLSTFRSCTRDFDCLPIVRSQLRTSWAVCIVNTRWKSVSLDVVRGFCGAHLHELTAPVPRLHNLVDEKELMGYIPCTLDRSRCV